MRIRLSVGAVVCCVALIGCATPSPWKIGGGPASCRQICESWGLEFTAMVAVGDQEPLVNEGATACVCQPADAVASAPSQAAVAVATGLAAPIQHEYDEQDDDTDVWADDPIDDWAADSDDSGAGSSSRER